MDILLVIAVIVVFVIERRRARAGRAHVERWAADNDMQLRSCRFRYLRLHRRAQFNVTMIDAQGRTRKGLATVAGRDGSGTAVALDETSAGTR